MPAHNIIGHAKLVCESKTKLCVLGYACQVISKLIDDEYISFAKQHDMTIVRGHALEWYAMYNLPEKDPDQQQQNPNSSSRSYSRNSSATASCLGSRNSSTSGFSHSSSSNSSNSPSTMEQDSAPPQSTLLRTSSSPDATSPSPEPQPSRRSLTIESHPITYYPPGVFWPAQGGPDHYRRCLRTRIQRDVGYCRGKFTHYDVWNEVVHHPGLLTRWGLFNPLFADAFKWAHAADPDARLYLNDYGLIDSEQGDDWEMFWGLVKGLIANGVPIHGIGIQAHLRAGAVSPEIMAFR